MFEKIKLLQEPHLISTNIQVIRQNAFSHAENKAFGVSSDSKLCFARFYPMLQESIALACLKRDLLQMSGNIHFYKSGKKYILFRTDGEASKSESRSPLFDKDSQHSRT